MLVREYLHQAGMSKEELAEFLGHQSTASVTKKFESEMPKRWGRLLDERDGIPLTAVGEETPDESMRDPNNIPPDWEQESGRMGDSDPSKPLGSNTVIGPQTIKLTTVKGYIEMIYSGAAALASTAGDDIAADAITRYTPDFSEAWINYIESDPRIMKWLETLMIGTPLGNLIGVHAIAVGSYVFARATAKQIATAIAGEHSDNGNGADHATAPDFMG